MLDCTKEKSITVLKITAKYLLYKTSFFVRVKYLVMFICKVFSYVYM